MRRTVCQLDRAFCCRLQAALICDRDIHEARAEACLFSTVRLNSASATDALSWGFVCPDIDRLGPCYTIVRTWVAWGRGPS